MNNCHLYHIKAVPESVNADIIQIRSVRGVQETEDRICHGILTSVEYISTRYHYLPHSSLSRGRHATVHIA
jgi:hypothetical protein